MSEHDRDPADAASPDTPSDGTRLPGIEARGTTPTGKVPVQPWMAEPETQAVWAAITAGGGEARFVGGCVRNALLNRPAADIDIATVEPPERVIELLGAAGIRAIPTGIEHGTVTAIAGERHYEITTLRVDVETDGRHARVRFVDDWQADAARRDFTINSLSCTPEGYIYDPFGGIDDLAHGQIRFVGLAKERIAEDLLRVLRFFRFFAVYGRPPAGIDALAACRAAAPRLAGLSADRVREEMFRLLLAPNPADTILLMHGEKVLEVLLPEAGDVGRLRLVAWLETTAMNMDSIQPDALRRLAALLDTDPDGAAAVARRLNLSKVDSARLIAVTAPVFTPHADDDGPTRRRLMQRHSAETVRDVALLTWAAARSVAPHGQAGDTEGWQALLAETETWTPKELPIDGDDILALGIEAGPRIGELLDAMTRWWEKGDFEADRDDCLATLRDLKGVAGN